MKRLRKLTTLAALALCFLVEGFLTDSVYANDPKPLFGREGSMLYYSIIGNNNDKEQLTIKRRIFGIFSSGVSISRNNAEGVNICATSNSEIGYAFFKDSVYRLDLKKNSITLVDPNSIDTKMFYLMRFEPKKGSKSAVLLHKAPNLGFGPKEPCALWNSM